MVASPTLSVSLGKAAEPKQYPHTPEDLRKEANYPIWVRLRAGDRGARDELVVRYAPLVKYVIGRMAISLPAAMDSDDVLSAGTVGLLHAIDRFDPDQGVRFETYALQRIRGAIIDTIRSLSPLSRGAGRRGMCSPFGRRQVGAGHRWSPPVFTSSDSGMSKRTRDPKQPHHVDAVAAVLHEADEVA